MGFNFNIGFNSSMPSSVERNSDGSFFFETFTSDARHNRLLTERQKLNAVLSNPAVLKVFTINCDLFSMGKINQKKGETDFLYSKRSKPNFKQTWTQFLWEYMFWVQTGTAYLWNPSGASILSENNTIQWLNPVYMEFDTTVIDKLKSLVFSEATYKDILKGTVRYDLGNGQTKVIPLNEITPFFDLSNCIDGNFYKGASRLDALYKVISNSEQALDAKAINLEFTKKFMVSGKNSDDNIMNLVMPDGEKNSIESSMRSNKSVHAVKTPVNISRFVENIASLKLDDSYYNDFFMIGSMYGIPKDVLESAIRGNSTYDNQEKAIGRHVDYVMKPKGQMLTDELEVMFKYKDLVMSWGHLSFNQVFELQKEAVLKAKLDNAILAKNNALNTEDYED
jgi:hypothetical protein